MVHENHDIKVNRMRYCNNYDFNKQNDISKIDYFIFKKIRRVCKVIYFPSKILPPLMCRSIAAGSRLRLRINQWSID